MATAGMGDVLSGLIAALVGQGAYAFNGAQQGAWIHSAAADEAVINLGRRSLLATDLFDYIASQVESLTTI